MNREQRRKEAHQNRRKAQIKKKRITRQAQLKKEVKALQQELKTIKLENAKNRFIKNLKITGNIALYLTPFVLAGSMAVGMNKLNYGTLPFVRDYQTLKKQVFFDYQEDEYTLKTTYQDEKADIKKNTLTVIYPADLEGYTELVCDYNVADLENEDTASLQQAILNKDYTYIQQNIKTASMIYEQTNQEEKENLPQVNTHLEYETQDKIEFYETKEDNILASLMFFVFMSIFYLLLRTVFKLNLKTMQENIHYAKREAEENKIDTYELEQKIEIKKQKIKQLGGTSNGK